MHEIPTIQRTTYLRGLLQSYGRLSLPLGSGLSFSLLQIFQPLRLRQSAADEKKPQKRESDETQLDARKDVGRKHKAEDDDETLDVLAESGIEALNKSPHGRIVILGSPGTGKTTVLKHLLYHQAQSALENSEVPLPIFLSLPDLAQMGQDLEAYLTHIANTMGLDADYGQTLFHAIQRGNAFVCLDSLDEVLPRLRTGIIRQINELAQVSGNTWIVGSRFTDYKGGQFQQGQFLEWDLQPLDRERRLKLATQLLPELQRQMTPSTHVMHTPDPYMYVQQLSEHQQTASWGMNPLLFSLGAVVYLRHGSLSGSRAMFYREVIAALLETRGGNLQLHHILAHSALELYQIKGRTFTAADLQAVLINLNIAQEATWDVAEMQYHVLNSGLLDVVVTDTYSFRHQTFQEYLVAFALAERFMSQDEQIRETAYQFAWNKHTYSRWNEVERLLIGILVQDYGELGIQQAQAWLTRLLQQRHSPEGDPGYLSLELAIKALGEVAQLPEWQTKETLELEQLAATIWGEEVINFVARTSWGYGYAYERYRITTADIGHLRPAAQRQTIEILLTGLLADNYNQLDIILGAMHSRYLTQYLLEFLECSPHEDQQRSIKSIFAHLGEFAPIDFLLDELSSRDQGNINKAETALTQLASYVPAEKLIPILRMSGFGRSQAATNILRQIAPIKELPIPDLLSVLRDGQKESSFQAACVLASIQHPAAIDLLLAHLDDAKVLKRLRALQALGQYKMRDHIDRVIVLMKDNSILIRREAVKFLASFGSAAPLDQLVQAASDPDDSVRRQAIEALGQLGDRAPLDALIQATGDPEISSTAICAIIVSNHTMPSGLVLSTLKNLNLVYSTINILSDKGMIRRMPIEPLLAIYERDWQNSETILGTLSHIGYLLTNEYLINQPGTGNENGQRVAADWLVGQQATSTLIAERMDTLIDKCYPPSIRAIAILGSEQEPYTVDALLQTLSDERWHVSSAAATELSKRADACPQEDLLALLTHQHAWVRANALEILTRCTKRPMIEPLVAALHDKNYQVREAAAKALRPHGEEAPLDELLAATLDDDFAVCREAAITLSKVGQRDPALAVAGVVNFMRHEGLNDEYSEWAEIQQIFEDLSSYAPAELLLQAMYDLSVGERDVDNIANALGLMGDRTPLAQLTRALQDKKQNIRRAAALALSMTGQQAPVSDLIKALSTKNSTTRQAMIDALTKVSEHGHVPDDIFLQKIFKKRDHNTYIRLFEAFTAQGKRIPDEIVLDALEHIAHKDTSVILEYLIKLPELLAVFPERLVAEALASYIDGQRYRDEPDTAKIVIRLLPRLSVDSILATLTHRKSALRIGGLILLAEHPEAISLEPILAVLDDPDYNVRYQAIDCLQKRPEELPVQAIIACLQDHNEWVCKSAIAALGSLGEHAPLSELIAMLDVPTPEIRLVAIQVLAQPSLCKRVPTEKFVAALGEYDIDEDQKAKQSVLEALHSKDPQLAIEHAIAALGDSNVDFALRAFQFLERTHPAIIPEIVQEAMALCQGGKPGRFFRSLSMNFLAEVLGDIDQANPVLIARLSDLLDWPYGEVRMNAARALGQLRRNIPDATIRRLLDLRHDPQSRAVREAADEALAKILSLETGIEDD